MTVRPEVGQRRPARPAPARRGRRAGRLLVGGAVHRRRHARAGVADHDPRRQSQPAPHRPARRARADGRARRDPRAPARSAPSRSGTSRCASAELTATTIRADEVPLLVDELPLFGLLAAGARGESWVYGAGELRLKETDRIEAVGRRAAGDRRPREGPRGRLLGHRCADPAARRAGRRARRPPDRDARAPSPGSGRRDGVEIEGAESAAISFPGFYDLLDRIVQR